MPHRSPGPWPSLIIILAASILFVLGRRYAVAKLRGKIVWLLLGAAVVAVLALEWWRTHP